MLGSESAEDAGDALCILRDKVALWSLAKDERLNAAEAPAQTPILADTRGCLFLIGDTAYRLTPQGAPEKVRDKITSFELLPSDGTLGRGATAALGPFVGYSNGTVERDRHALPLEHLPNAAVVKMLIGPSDSLILGFMNGVVGVWSIQDGAELAHLKLHGPIKRLLLEGTSLRAVTELGDFADLDLTAFGADYCTLLAKVAERIPVEWHDGSAQKSASAPRCSR